MNDTDWQEWRRLRAWELSRQGWKQSAIAEALGVSPGAVSQWLKRVREEGPEGLRARAAGGPSPRLSPEQLAGLPRLLAAGPQSFGYADNTWTNSRIAEVIARTYAVHYHPSHISRIMRRAQRIAPPPLCADDRFPADVPARWPPPPDTPDH